MCVYVKIRISGLMPERALLRLRRAEIELRNVKKQTPTVLLLTVRKKDLEKVFAIYPKTCYTGYEHGPYQVQVLGELGIFKWVTWAKTRVAFILGALAFCIGQAIISRFVFGVEFVGSHTYIRETMATLEEYGVKKGKVYRRGEEDLICSALLRLRGVEFCSIKKRGLYLYIEMQVNEERLTPIRDGAFVSNRTGKVVSITALNGTPIKSVGDSVKKGEKLIEDYIQTPSGERVKTQAIGRAKLSCVYETVVETTEKEVAFAMAYLLAQIGENDEITGVETQTVEKGIAVSICFTATLSFNI